MQIRFLFCYQNNFWNNLVKLLYKKFSSKGKLSPKVYLMLWTITSLLVHFPIWIWFWKTYFFPKSRDLILSINSKIVLVWKKLCNLRFKIQFAKWRPKSLYRSRARRHFMEQKMCFGLVLGRLAILKKKIGSIMSNFSQWFKMPDLIC